VLGLDGTDFTTLVACPVGYRAADDKYAMAPKVRFKTADVVEHILIHAGSCRFCAVGFAGVRC
jgi:hypothetical protein